MAAATITRATERSLSRVTRKEESRRQCSAAALKGRVVGGAEKRVNAGKWTTARRRARPLHSPVGYCRDQSRFAIVRACARVDKSRRARHRDIRAFPTLCCVIIVRSGRCVCYSFVRPFVRWIGWCFAHGDTRGMCCRLLKSEAATAAPVRSERKRDRERSLYVGRIYV